MSTPLLATKLQIPYVRLDLVQRRHLVERLNEALTHRLTVVSAPAGFGKTTLLVEWVGQRQPHVAWVSLDENDNDPIRFWTYIIAALQKPNLGLGENALAILHAREQLSPPLSIAFEADNEAEWTESFLIVLLNEIAAAASSMVLVLDDYHAITAPAIHHAIAYLLEHLPASIHLIIAGRADPPLPLPRLRARGQLAEMRAGDLRFTPDEAAAFLNQVMHLKLSADQVTALESRTEGWIAGLQMAALSLRGREDPSTFVSTFGGSHRDILDYLVQEVLNRQPKNIEDFLLQTSLFDPLNGGLCDAVLGADSGHCQVILEHLERANLFISPLDDERRWYRYHPLFAEALRSRLAQTQPGLVRDLHHRASVWYEENGFRAEAIQHALSAQDYERAANFLEQTGFALLGLVSESILHAWLNALPRDIVRARPNLAITDAWVLALKGEYEAAEAQLDEIEPRLATADAAGFTEATRGDLLGQVAVLRVQIAFSRQDLAGAIALCQKALERLPEDQILTRATVLFHLGLAERVRGDVAAERDLRQAGRLAQRAGNLFLELLVLDNLAALQEVQGKLHEAEQSYQQILQLGTHKDGRLPTIAGLAQIGLGKLRREWNDLVAARRYLDEGIALSQPGGIGQEIEFDGWITMALVSQEAGNAKDADEMLRKALHIAHQRHRPDWVLRVATFAARFALARGNVDAAARWAITYGIRAGGELTEWSEIENATLARLWIAQHKPHEALSLLGSMLESSEAAGRMGRVIEILALQALAFYASGDRTAAMQAMERAITLAEPEGYIRIFVDEGEPIAALLRQLAARGIAVEYVARLLRALSSSPLPPPPGVPPLFEPLSERELQVLRLVAAGLTNQQIAGELVVVVATVKAHINRIYRKLEVTNRVQAVTRARELNLL